MFSATGICDRRSTTGVTRTHSAEGPARREHERRGHRREHRRPRRGHLLAAGADRAWHMNDGVRREVLREKSTEGPSLDGLRGRLSHWNAEDVRRRLLHEQLEYTRRALEQRKRKAFCGSSYVNATRRIPAIGTSTLTVDPFARDRVVREIAAGVELKFTASAGMCASTPAAPFRCAQQSGDRAVVGEIIHFAEWFPVDSRSR